MSLSDEARRVAAWEWADIADLLSALADENDELRRQRDEAQTDADNMRKNLALAVGELDTYRITLEKCRATGRAWKKRAEKAEADQ